MNKYIKKVVFIIFQMVLLIHVHGQNPEIIQPELFTNIDNSQWIEFVKKYKTLHGSTSEHLKILQIGDSHIQGGYFTNKVLELMAENDTISVNLGMTFPYSLAGTNGNERIRYYSHNNWDIKKTTELKSGKMPISGYQVSCSDSIIELAVKLNFNSDRIETDRFRLYHNPGNFIFSSVEKCKTETHVMNDSISYSELNFSTNLDSMNLRIQNHKWKNNAFRLYMVEFLNSKSEITFSSLGINGITFEKYLSVIDFMPWIKQINPDCLIVSLGTNDVFAGMPDVKLFSKRISFLIDTIRKQFPDIAIIITSPGDHLTHRKNINRAITPSVKAMYNVALSHHCVFWDFFSVMGGEGSSRDWHKYGWMFRDYIHLSKEGYKQQGSIFYKTFINSIEQTWKNNIQLVN